MLSAICLAALALGGCGSTRVVGSTPLHFFLEVPTGWAVYDKAQVQRAGVMGDQSPPLYLAIFSASPHPSVHDLNNATKYPWGIVEVKVLPHSQALALSLEGLNDQLFNLDAMVQQGESVQELVPPKLLVNGSLRGVTASFEVPTLTSAVEDYQVTSWVNSASNRVWIMALGCSASCFQSDQSSINRVMRTFTVQDKGI